MIASPDHFGTITFEKWSSLPGDRLWYVTVAPAKGYHPAIALKRQHDAATPVLGCLGEGPDALPLGRGIVRDGINARGIAEIDANCSLLGQRTQPIDRSRARVGAPRPEASTTRSAAIVSLGPLPFS
jgi:hypothetical protein